MPMKYGQVAGIGKPVSRLVQGCTGISLKNPGPSAELLDAVFALGCTAFDTALVYGGGDSERMLGKWIADRGLREKVVVITKGAHHNADRKRVTSFDIAADLHDSLARMKTPYVDLYLLHRDDPDVPVGPIVEALNEQRAAGRIRAFGGSNWGHQRLAQANEYAQKHGLTGFAASSPNFCLAVQREPPWAGCVSISGPDQRDARQWYRRTQMPIFSWSSLGGGFLSGAFSRANRDSMTGPNEQATLKVYGSDESFDRLEWAQKVAAELGLAVPQAALAWIFNQGLDVYALTACRTGQEMADNIRALEAKLPANPYK